MGKKVYLQKKRPQSDMLFSRRKIEEAVGLANLAMSLLNLPLVVKLLNRMSDLDSSAIANKLIRVPGVSRILAKADADNIRNVIDVIDFMRTIMEDEILDESLALMIRQHDDPFEFAQAALQAIKDGSLKLKKRGAANTRELIAAWYKANRKRVPVKEQAEKRLRKPTVLVLTGQEDSKVTGTAERILKVSTEMSLSAFPVLVNKAYIADEDATDNSITIHNYDGEGNKITVQTDNTVVFVRGSAILNNAGLGIMQVLEQAGASMVNGIQTMQLCQNKLASALTLDRHGIPTPKTAFVSNEDSIGIALKKIGGQFPVVVKTITGSEGIGVAVVDSEQSLKSVLQSLWKYDAEVILQEFMKIKYDVRTIVADGKIVACMKRIKGKKDFRTNKALGNDTEPYDLSEEEKDLVRRVAALSGGRVVGVDHITVGGKHYVLEVNGSPGSGADKYRAYFGEKRNVNGDQMMSHIVSLMTQNDARRSNEQTVGYIEKASIEGFDVKAKLDTGNGSYNAVHAEDIELKGNEVSFLLLGKKRMTLPVKETKRIHLGGGEFEDRPVVQLDMTLGRKDYTDVYFALADRKLNVYPILIGKPFLSSANYSVSVNKKFTLG